MRLFAISNIHGYYDEFMALLDYVQYDPCSDQLFILGGLVDYGPKSLEVVEECIRLQKEGATILRGQGNNSISTLSPATISRAKKRCVRQRIRWCISTTTIQALKTGILNFQKPPFYTEYGDYVLSHAGMDINYKDNFAYCLGIGTSS